MSVSVLKVPESPAVKAPALLELRDISKRFAPPVDMAIRLARLIGLKPRLDVVHAVDNVSMQIFPGEVVGLVGESGCGKSTLGRIAVGLYAPTSGKRVWKGEMLGNPAREDRRQLKMQMVFQDAYASLNPRFRLDDIVGEAAVVHGLVKARERSSFVADLLRRVGLDPSLSRRFPHQLSGGQRARVGIARALALQPEFIVCDEAVAALDVSIQAQVINLFMELRQDLNLTYLFISHDLGVIQHISDRVVIMYLGRVVESATTDELFQHPNHPYTQALLAEVPRLEVGKRKFVAIQGEIPSPIDPPPGCHFNPRCPKAFARCKEERPVLKEIAPNHFSACHLNEA